jgi:NADH dehydrogenase/NADH:ubiquinone oxidoreductase subunit G
MTPLAAAADIVLPGAAWVEKEATYTNDRGLLQATARVMAPPGDAHEDWRVLADVATAAGITTSYADAHAVRAAIATAMGGVPASRASPSDVPEADGREDLAERINPSSADGTTCSRISRWKVPARARNLTHEVRGDEVRSKGPTGSCESKRGTGEGFLTWLALTGTPRVGGRR